MSPVKREEDEHKQANDGQNKSQNQIDNKSRLQVTVFKGEEDRIAKAEKYLIGISAFLLFLNIITVIYIIRQTNANEVQAKASITALNMSKESAESSDIISQKSIAIAESSNILTQQNLDLSRKRFIIENRPWIGVKNVVFDTFEVGKKYSVSVTIQNYGKTPALDFGAFIGSEAHTVLSYKVFSYVGKVNGNKPNSVCHHLKQTFLS